MKKYYRLDEDPKNPVPIIEEEEDKLERGDRPNSIWVEQIVRIFGETYHTEQYRLMTRNQLKRLKLWPQNSTNFSIPKTSTIPLIPKSTKKIQFKIVYAFRDED